MHELILSNIAKHISLDESEVAFFISLLKVKRVSKKDTVLQNGQVCKEINFVKSGMLRAYYADEMGKESTIMFAISDWWITDMYCFANELPAMVNIVAMEDSVVFSLSKQDMEKLLTTIPKFERYFRLLMQNAYIREQLRIIQNLSQSAEERYQYFRAKYPQVAKQVTQKQIASYLGITPEFLSKLRRKQNVKLES
jgi:CRP-like cAMP-binding protein